MKEAQFQTMWHHHLDSHKPMYPEVYELKICKKDTFPFSAVKQHQIDGLINAQEGMFHKISDSLPVFGGNAHMRFTTKKPFDCLWIKATGYVCILFYVPRKPKVVFQIKIDTFIKIMSNYPKKSIRVDHLNDMALTLPGIKKVIL